MFPISRALCGGTLGAGARVRGPITAATSPCRLPPWVVRCRVRGDTRGDQARTGDLILFSALAIGINDKTTIINLFYLFVSICAFSVCVFHSYGEQFCYVVVW